MLHTMRTRAIPPLLALAVALLVARPGQRLPARPQRARADVAGRRRRGSPPQHVTVDGTDREYLLSIPAGYDPSKPAPLLFDFHGFSSNMQEQALYTQTRPAGRRRGYVVITPNGAGRRAAPWSFLPVGVGQPRRRVRAGDAAHDQPHALHRPAPRLLHRHLQRRDVLHRARVRAPRTSGGDRAGGRDQRHRRCASAGTPRVSVLAFHGTADPIVPYQGGEYFSGWPLGSVLGVRRRSRSTAPPPRGPRSTGAGPRRRSRPSPTTCSTSCGPTARRPARSSSTASSVVATPGRGRCRCVPSGSAPTTSSIDATDAHPRLLRRPPPPLTSSCGRSERTRARVEGGSELGEGGGEEGALLGVVHLRAPARRARARRP